MKKAEGEISAPKPLMPGRFGAKSPAPSSPSTLASSSSSSPVSPPALRKLKPVAASPIGSPSWSPVSTPTSNIEEIKKSFSFSKLVQNNEENTSTEQTNGNHTTPSINNSDDATLKEIPKPAQSKNEETAESQKIKNLESEINRLTSSKEEQLKEITRLTSELDQAKGIISSHELANGKLNQQIVSLQSQVGDLESDNKKMVKDFEEFKKLTLERFNTHVEPISEPHPTTTNIQTPNGIDSAKPISHIDNINNTHNTNNISPRASSNHFESSQPSTSSNISTNNFDTTISPPTTPTKHSSTPYYQQNGKSENTDYPRNQNHTPPPMTPSFLYNDSLSRSPSPSPSKLSHSNSTTNPNYNFGKYVSYANSRKSPIPPAHQSKNTLQDLQGLLSTAQDQKSNVEILLQNIDVTLASAPSPLNASTERPMTPEETVYFRGEKKNLERELARLDGVISELKGQKTRCDSKLERAKQKIEDSEAKLASTPSFSSSNASPSPYPSLPPSYLEVRDLSPSNSFDSSIPMSKLSISPSSNNKSTLSSAPSYSPTRNTSTPNYSPSRNISPYFYYSNNIDKMELPPPTDRFSPSPHKLTSDHIQRFTPQFVPDAQKLKSFPSNSTLPHATEKVNTPPVVPKDEPTRPSFEWNYYFSTRS